MSCRKLSRADLTEFLGQHYKAPRMVLAAAGGVEHRQLLDLAQKHFGGASGTYAEDAVPTLSPCRFTGSQVGCPAGRAGCCLPMRALAHPPLGAGSAALSLAVPVPDFPP